MAKTSTERSREYRERKRARMPKLPKPKVQKPKKVSEKKAKTSTERSRECRARKRANIKLPPRPPPKSNYQRQKEFQERQKALKNAATATQVLLPTNLKQEQPTTANNNNASTSSPKKTNKMINLSVTKSELGEICTAKCTVDSGQTILVVSVNILPNKRIDEIIDLLHEILLAFTPEGAALLKRNWDEMPIVLRCGLNINFTEPQTKPLIDFLEDKLQLKMNNDKTIVISNSDSEPTFETVFCRYLDKQIVVFESLKK